MRELVRVHDHAHRDDEAVRDLELLRRRRAAVVRGVSNAKAKRELGWTLRYPSWRQGFPATYGWSLGPAQAA